MDLRERVKRDLKILSLERKEKEKSEIIIKDRIKKSFNFKEKIKKIPILGNIAWYIYGLLKSPFRIRELYKERDRLYEELNFLRRNWDKERDRLYEELNFLRRNWDKERDRLYEELNFLRNDLSFRYTEPEKFKVLNLDGFLKRELKDKNLDFYVLFEEVFRGEEIKERISKYLSYIKESFTKIGDNSVFLDFGCGRGELMELLKENEIPVIGVEINEEYVSLLRKKGYNVHHGDGIEYLKNLPDNSLLGISAIHVIEHLEFERQKEFIELSYRKIKPEGLLIIETPNPKCSVALANFYIDFTHIRPCPYEFLCFLFEYAGFKDIKLILSSPVDRAFRTGNPFGDYMDYAILGFKR